jgi:hypothetical protein
MMKKTHIVFVICLLLGALIGSIGLLVKKNTAQPGLPSGKASAINDNGKSIPAFLLDKRIVSFKTWDVGDYGDEPLLCVVQTFDNDPHYEGRGEKLTIFDKSGMTLYEDYFTAVESIELSGALRTEESQLLVSVNYGGNTTSFLQMLDYRDGKVVKVPIEGDGEYDSSEPQVRPQFRHGIVPAKEPYQIMLTEGVGLASPAEKTTHVYRYQNGSYKEVGAFNQHDVDDYMEKLITKDKVKSTR